MRRHYAYVVNGSSADAQTWITEGNVECEFQDPDSGVTILDHVMRDSFAKLTRGAAIFGKPGVGCKGPYDITQVLIKQVKQ